MWAWDAGTSSVAFTVARNTRPYNVAVAGDGSVASTWQDGSVLVLDAAGDELATLSVGGGRETHEVAFSPDGSLLAVTATPALVESVTTDLSAQVVVWETGSFTEHGTIDLGAERPYDLAFTPDGDLMLAVTHDGEQSRLRSWATDSVADAGATQLGDWLVLGLAVSPDGGTVAVAGANRQVELHSLTGDAPVRALAAHPDTVRTVAFSPDGTKLATSNTSDDVIRLWDLTAGDKLADLVSAADPPNAVAFSPDGRTLASAGPDGFLGLWTIDPATAITRLCAALGSAPDAASHPLCG